MDNSPSTVRTFDLILDFCDILTSGIQSTNMRPKQIHLIWIRKRSDNNTTANDHPILILPRLMDFIKFNQSIWHGNRRIRHIRTNPERISRFTESERDSKFRFKQIINRITKRLAYWFGFKTQDTEII